MRLVWGLVLCASPVWADDVARVQSCLADGGSCFSILALECADAHGDPAILSPNCWTRERDAWQVVLDQAYSKVLLETFTAPKSVTQMIRAEQDAWITYRDLRCAVQSMSNPQTSGSVEAGCLAKATFDRAVDVLARTGADWVEY